MARYFTGTNTGNLYQVGQVYQLANGDKAAANPDGSFTNLRSGVVTKGSSQADNVSWFESSSSGLSGRPDELYTATSGPGVERASVQPTGDAVQPPASTGGSGAGSAGAATGPVPGPGAKQGGSLSLPASKGDRSSGPKTNPDGSQSIGGSDKPRYLEFGTWPLVGPVSWEVAPGFVDAQDLEDIYGDDLFSYPGLLVKTVYDTGVNVDRFGRHVSAGVAGAASEISKVVKTWETPEAELPDPMSYQPMSVW